MAETHQGGLMRADDGQRVLMRVNERFSRNLQSQPKVSGHRFPSFNVAPMMSTFLSICFQPAKQHWARGMGEKGSHCPMLLSEIVVISIYIFPFHVYKHSPPAVRRAGEPWASEPSSFWYS